MTKEKFAIIWLVCLFVIKIIITLKQILCELPNVLLGSWKKFPYVEFRIQAGQVIVKRDICLLNSNLCISLKNNPNVMTRWTMCPV